MAARPLAMPRPARKAPRSGGRGFTLLELLVVMAIVGVLAGLVVPSLGGSERRQLRTETEKLVQLVNRARQEALLSSRIWRVVFRPGEGTYRFQKRRPDGEFAAVEAGMFGKTHDTAGVDWDDLTINGQPVLKEGEIHLFPTGEQDAFRVVLRAGEHERVVVLDVVGRARLGTEGADD